MSDFNFDPMTGEPIKKNTESTPSVETREQPSYRCDPNDNSYRFTYSDASGRQSGPMHREQPKAKEKPEKKRLSFGAMLGRAAAIAAVCGLVGGGVFAGVNYGAGTFNSILEIASADKSGRTESKPSDEKKDEVVATVGDTGSVLSSTVSANPKVTVYDVSDITEQCLPSIVSITNMSVVEYQNWWGQNISQDRQSAASGIIVAQDEDNLYIATNHHVVTGADKLTVSFCDGTVVAATVRGSSESNDVAVCAVPLKDIETETLREIRVATIDDRDDVKVGEAAIVIGNALGTGQSVTAGVISAIDRDVNIVDETTGKQTVYKLIQTDAAINPGNSGGALLNGRGEVIGIASSKYSNTSVEGMCFAIPMSRVAGIINELILREEVVDEEMGYLGISGVDVTASIAANYGMPEGVCIAKVYAGTGAKDAGLMKGDIIAEFAGQNVSSMEELSEMVKYHAAGESVKVAYYRANNGEYELNEVEVVLTARPADLR